MLSNSINAMDNPVEVSISDNEILDEYKDELVRNNVKFIKGDDGIIYVDKKDLNLIISIRDRLSEIYLSSDRAASYSKFMKHKIEEYLKEKSVEFDNICFFNGVYTVWDLSDYDTVQAAHKNAIHKIQRLYKETPKENWNDLVDDSSVDCP